MQTTHKTKQAQNKCNHETKKCPNKEPTTTDKKAKTKTHREKTKMTREYKEDPMMKDKGKSIGQKQVEQMMGTHEMTKDERKRSKKEKQRTHKVTDGEAPGT